MLYIVIPKGLSQGVFNSQVVTRFNNIEHRYISFDKNQNLVGELYAFADITDNDLVYIRSVTDFMTFYYIKKFKKLNVKIQFDFRGLISEESFLRKKSYLSKYILSMFEKFAFKKADYIFTVSNNLRDYLLNKYYPKDIHVVPCCIPSEKCVKKQIYKDFNDKLDFIYVGSISAWQSFDEICRLYRTLCNENTNFTVVTHDMDKAQHYLDKYSLSARLLTGDKNLVEKELDQADFGFIIRDNNIVNTTSSPVKFLEYTSRGVIPIMSSYVGDYSEIFSDCSVVLGNEHNITINDLGCIRSNAEIYTKLHERTLQFSWDNFVV